MSQFHPCQLLYFSFSSASALRTPLSHLSCPRVPRRCLPCPRPTPTPLERREEGQGCPRVAPAGVTLQVLRCWGAHAGSRCWEPAWPYSSSGTGCCRVSNWAPRGGPAELPRAVSGAERQAMRGSSKLAGTTAPQRSKASGDEWSPELPKG